MAQQKNIPIDCKKLESILAERGVSHYRLSKSTGISEPSISRIFKTESASMFHLRLICEALGIELGDIYRWVDSPGRIVEAKPIKPMKNPDNMHDLFEGFLKLYCLENHYSYSDEDSKKLYSDLEKNIRKRFKKKERE